MVLTHAATGRPFATKYVQEMFGAERETMDDGVSRRRDRLGERGRAAAGRHAVSRSRECLPPIPSFAPEHFGVVRCKDAGKHKQFRRGIEQLDTEGVVQVLSSDLRGDQAPVLAAVGPLQFDVVLHRLEHEFGARSDLDPAGLRTRPGNRRARRGVSEGAARLEVLRRRLDGALLALFTDKWRLAAIQRDNPSIRLDPMLAGGAVVA